ncbi:pseudouridine synthase [Microcoleus sp. bin38.metabat.b11b12b14.051]|uniref:RluA family pseudouridine synthase n=1 Tax=Microcoleus sp. bin38.metabat.b11b12b14.051 TaxID=2742709 RepID=UPI0025F05757|nr:pseudouridine synthase [Microcoleus sp. bin38.metabat.b11b12b14.051]
MQIAHALLDFTDCLTDGARGSIGSHPSYWYQGYCPQSGESLRLPRTRMSEALARGLMKCFAADDSYAVEGKMYGILLVEMPWGEQRILKAFSGLLKGCGLVDGWVPPIPGRSRVALEEARTLAQLAQMKQQLIALKQIPQRQEHAALLSEFELQLQVLNVRHRNCKQQRDEQRQLLCQTLAGETLLIALEELNQASRWEGIERKQLKQHRDETLAPLKQLIEATDGQMRVLKQHRKELSRQLQAQMHEAYTLVNFGGESRSISSLMPPNSIPTGTGDCCAPKLLHCAAVHNLKPLAMAEFWWGPPSGDKVPGEFYGACSDRCQPLMGFLLSGLAQNQTVSEAVAGVETHHGGGQDAHPTIHSGGWQDAHPTIHHGGGQDAHPTIHSGGWQDAHPTIHSQSGGTGILPVTHPTIHSGGGQDAHPTIHKNYGGTGILPVTDRPQMLPIVYQDKWLIAIDKPSGLLSVPGRYLENQDSVLSRLRNLLPDGLELTAVHRLDMQTSGILLLARDKETACQIRQQFEKRLVQKVYEAVLSGTVNVESGTIALPVKEDPVNSLLQQVDCDRGKPSITRFQVMAKQGKYDRVEFLPLTGRTHQLRVHAADVRGLGMPILGDRLYGCRACASRLHLHARELSLEHPQLREWLQLQVATPF